MNGKNNSFKYSLLVELNSCKYNFSLYKIYKIRIQLNQGDMNIYNDNEQKMPRWIKDYFNNLENQKS